MPVIDYARKLKPALLLGFVALFFGLATSPTGTDLETARVKEIAADLSPKPAWFGRPITDRAAWAKLAQSPAVASVVPRAQKLPRTPPPPRPDDRYLDFSKTGRRPRSSRLLKDPSIRI